MPTPRATLVALLAGLAAELEAVRTASGLAADHALALGADPAAGAAEEEHQHQDAIARHLVRAIEETRAAIQAGDFRGRRLALQEAAAAEQTRAQADQETILRLEQDASECRAVAEQLRRDLTVAREQLAAAPPRANQEVTADAPR